MTTPTGGFPAIRYNEVRDITAEKFIEVCPNVKEQLSGELLALRLSISYDEEQLDISANGVWGGNFKCVQEARSRKKRDAMTNASEKLNIVQSQILIFRAREAWASLLPRFTKDMLR